MATQQRVRADWRLRVVFEQLIENALKHTGEPPAVEITVTADEDSVSVRVADDGPGVPADELVGIVGERDRTQLTHGSGLGLWLVRLVLDDYGGDLSYESPPEYGSVFTVTLQTGVDGQLRPETGPAEQT
ncbi:MAG: signal transduction histidine kinase [Halovenus sp.]